MYRYHCCELENKVVNHFLGFRSCGLENRVDLGSLGGGRSSENEENRLTREGVYWFEGFGCGGGLGIHSWEWIKKSPPAKYSGGGDPIGELKRNGGEIGGDI